MVPAQDILTPVDRLLQVAFRIGVSTRGRKHAKQLLQYFIPPGLFPRSLFGQSPGPFQIVASGSVIALRVGGTRQLKELIELARWLLRCNGTRGYTEQDGAVNVAVYFKHADSII